MNKEKSKAKLWFPIGVMLISILNLIFLLNYSLNLSMAISLMIMIIIILNSFNSSVEDVTAYVLFLIGSVFVLAGSIVLGAVLIGASAFVGATADVVYKLRSNEDGT